MLNFALDYGPELLNRVELRGVCRMISTTISLRLDVLDDINSLVYRGIIHYKITTLHFGIFIHLTHSILQKANIVTINIAGA